MEWRKGWWVLLVLLCLPLAQSASFGLNVEPIKNEIFRNDSASYEISINNFADQDGRFQVYTIDPAWNVKTVPNSPIIPAKSQESFVLYLRPTSSAKFGTQGVAMNFKEMVSGTLTRKDVVLNLRSGIPLIGEYAATVALDIVMPYEIDPRHPIPLRLELRNRNALDIPNISIVVTSPHFSSSSSVRLAPLSEKTKDIQGITIDPLTLPGEAELQVMLFYDGEVVNQLEKNYEIKEYTRVRERLEEESFFFKTVKTVTTTNEGNVKNTAVITVPTSFLKSLFVGSSLQYERTTENGKRVLLWKIPLNPNETKSFTYTENYRVLILLILMGILGGIAYLVLRSPVVLLKEAVGVAKKEGVSRIKVRIFVKNRSAKLIRGLQITDKVPSLAEVVKTEAPGTIAPTKIAVSEKQGTLLRWNLEVLEPYEERVLTYQAKSKLKIIGRMSLPNARGKFIVNGKDRVVYSNNIEIVEKFRDR